MGCELCKEIYMKQPVQCNPCGAIHAGGVSSLMQADTANFVELANSSRLCEHCGVNYVVQSMWSDLPGVSYVMQSTWHNSELCCVSYVEQSNWCKLCS
eukprot:5785427-Pyramimonas_sp.AAC.1